MRLHGWTTPSKGLYQQPRSIASREIGASRGPTAVLVYTSATNITERGVVRQEPRSPTRATGPARAPSSDQGIKARKTASYGEGEWTDSQRPGNKCLLGVRPRPLGNVNSSKFLLFVVPFNDPFRRNLRRKDDAPGGCRWTGLTWRHILLFVRLLLVRWTACTHQKNPEHVASPKSGPVMTPP